MAKRSSSVHQPKQKGHTAAKAKENGSLQGMVLLKNARAELSKTNRELERHLAKRISELLFEFRFKKKEGKLKRRGDDFQLPATSSIISKKSFWYWVEETRNREVKTNLYGGGKWVELFEEKSGVKFIYLPKSQENFKEVLANTMWAAARANLENLVSGKITVGLERMAAKEIENQLRFTKPERAKPILQRLSEWKSYNGCV